MTPLVQAALDLATEAHAGQYRRDGVTPYIEHPKAVRLKALDEMPNYFLSDTYKEVIEVVALGHDITEDTSTSEGVYVDALAAAFSDYPCFWPDIVRGALKTLNKNRYSSYLDYVITAKNNAIARVVKIADIKVNLADSPKPATREKYLLALHILES